MANGVQTDGATNGVPNRRHGNTGVTATSKAGTVSSDGGRVHGTVASTQGVPTRRVERT